MFDVPVKAILARVTGLLYDPATLRTYHTRYDPPPKNALLESRLVRRPTDSEEAALCRLNDYQRNIQLVLECLHCQSRRFYCPNGVHATQDEIIRDSIHFIGTSSPTLAPKSFKIVVAGMLGAGKSSICEAIERKYGFVHGNLACMRYKLSAVTVVNSIAKKGYP